MKKQSVHKITVVMRAVHLYTSLFLWPWMVIYATSGFVFNHNDWIKRTFNVVSPQWTLVREAQCSAASLPSERKAQTEALLARIELSGIYYDISPDANSRVIVRRSALGDYRITWTPANEKIVVERKTPFSLLNWIHFFHFKAGYAFPGFVHIAWAVLVDMVTISTWLWIISGIYIWALMPRKRVLGGICIIAGAILFIIFAVLLSRC